MDRSFLSDQDIIATTRDFVCLRASTYESAEEAQVLGDMLLGAVIALFGFNNRWNALMETDIEDSVTSFIKSKNYHGPEATT